MITYLLSTYLFFSLRIFHPLNLCNYRGLNPPQVPPRASCRVTFTAHASTEPPALVFPLEPHLSPAALTDSWTPTTPWCDHNKPSHPLHPEGKAAGSPPKKSEACVCGNNTAAQFAKPNSNPGTSARKRHLSGGCSTKSWRFLVGTSCLGWSRASGHPPQRQLRPARACMGLDLPRNTNCEAAGAASRARTQHHREGSRCPRCTSWQYKDPNIHVTLCKMRFVARRSYFPIGELTKSG